MGRVLNYLTGTGDAHIADGFGPNPAEIRQVWLTSGSASGM